MENTNQPDDNECITDLKKIILPIFKLILGVIVESLKIKFQNEQDDLENVDE